jgi:hypothetical protein
VVPGTKCTDQLARDIFLHTEINKVLFHDYQHNTPPRCTDSVIHQARYPTIRKMTVVCVTAQLAIVPVSWLDWLREPDVITTEYSIK